MLLTETKTGYFYYRTGESIPNVTNFLNMLKGAGQGGEMFFFKKRSGGRIGSEVAKKFKNNPIFGGNI